MQIYGYSVEPYYGLFVISSATKNNDLITCHCPLGIFESWKMQDDGVFFQSKSGEIFCKEAESKAIQYARLKSKEI